MAGAPGAGDGVKRAYVLIGASLGVLLRLLWRGGVTPLPRYLLRALLLLQGGVWASLLAWRERRRHGAALAAGSLPDDPIFIVGHWRTGSTYLHQLLALDSRLVAPTMLHCTYPACPREARRFGAQILGRAMRGRRPMDNVRVGLDAPQEDEWALLRLTGLSPLARMIFPRDGGYFLEGDDTFLPQDEAERRRWREALELFVRRLCLDAPGCRPVLKNPFHSLRVPLLRRAFPRARFVHIRRDPLRVVPSTVHMWEVVGAQNTLRRQWRPPGLEAVARVYARLTRTLERDLAALPAEQVAEVRFEALVARPQQTLEQLYQDLGLPYTDEQRQAVDTFLGQNADYRQNRYPLGEEQRQAIQRALESPNP